MRKTFLVCLLLSGLAGADSLPKPGQVYQSLKCDLNGDGRPERIELTAYRIQKESDSYWGQLRVCDNQGKLLWQAPQAKMAGDDFAFGAWPYGLSILEWLGKVEDHFELYSPRAQSDARPTTYRRYRWSGKAFLALPPKMLLLSGEDNFAWSDPIQWDGQKPLTWIATLLATPTGSEATVYASKAGGQGFTGRAKVSMSSRGVKVSRWTAKLAPST